MLPGRIARKFSRRSPSASAALSHSLCEGMSVPQEPLVRRKYGPAVAI